MLKNLILSSAAVGAIAFGSIAPLGAAGSAEAQPPDGIQNGGAAGLVAAVIQAQDIQVIDDIDVAFRDINVVRNVLNNSPFLNDFEVEVITIDDTLNDNNIQILTIEDAIVMDLVDVQVIDDVEVIVLEDVAIDIDDIVAVVNVLGTPLILT